MILGITGGTGCGKTTLLDCIRRRGGLVLDCDSIYHELLRTDAALLGAIDARFPGVVTAGKLDRKRLGAIVFADVQALQDLNAITHRAVKAKVLEALAEKPALAAVDAIALFEGGLAELCDVTVAVSAPEEARIARLMARDGISRDYAAARIRAQHEPEWFAARCDYLLENSESIRGFEGKCLAFLQEIGIMEAR